VYSFLSLFRNLKFNRRTGINQSVKNHHHCHLCVLSRRQPIGRFAEGTEAGDEKRRIVPIRGRESSNPHSVRTIFPFPFSRFALVKLRERVESWRLLSPGSRWRSRAACARARARGYGNAWFAVRVSWPAGPALVMVTRRSLTIIINIRTTTKRDANDQRLSGRLARRAGPLSKVPTAIRSLAIFNLFSSPLCARPPLPSRPSPSFSSSHCFCPPISVPPRRAFSYNCIMLPKKDAPVA